MPRFVVLRHEPGAAATRPLHWDLMLESGGALRTWALAREPSPGAAIDCEQLPDHRLAYLEYEGPITGERGTVSRWDEGQFEIAAETADELRLIFAGSRLNGTACLQRDASVDHRWNMTFSPGGSGPLR